MLDERPANTLKVKLSDYFKGICKEWEDNVKEGQTNSADKRAEEEAEIEQEKKDKMRKLMSVR